jgi:low molecular weight phosphotyrosine protein phosphatase
VPDTLPKSCMMTARHVGPLFVCHANCCRSFLACYLYQHLCKAPARSAGLEVGERISDRAERMLRGWGIEASGHQPLKLSRKLCDEAKAIFVMGPSYLLRMVWEYGEDLADIRFALYAKTIFSVIGYSILRLRPGAH